MANSSCTTGSNWVWIPIERLLDILQSHRDHPQLRHINTNAPGNTRRYSYYRWLVTHPETPVVFHEERWYKFHHDITSRRPYHQRTQVDIYPHHDNTEEESVDSTNVHIRNTLAIIEPGSPGSPHYIRPLEQGTPSSSTNILDPRNSNTMSMQTMAKTETISRTVTAGGGGEDPPPTGPPSNYQDPQ
jgi:hypothetical protein